VQQPRTIRPNVERSLRGRIGVESKSNRSFDHRLGRVFATVVQPNSGRRPVWPVGDHRHADASGFDSSVPGGFVEWRRADVLPVHLAARQLPVLGVLPSRQHVPTAALSQHRLQRDAPERRGEQPRYFLCLYCLFVRLSVCLSVCFSFCLHVFSSTNNQTFCQIYSAHQFFFSISWEHFFRHLVHRLTIPYLTFWGRCFTIRLKNSQVRYSPASTPKLGPAPL